MADGLFTDTAKLLDEHGWLPRVPADPSERRGRLTLRQALRIAAGLESAAWLPAYIDWTTTTAAYAQAHRTLEVTLSEERGGQPTDPEWWQAQSGRTIGELRQLLERAAKMAPSLVRSEPPPRLRSGCTRKLVSSLRVAGVVAASAASAMRTTRATLGKTVVRAVEGDALGDISSEQLVAALDRVASHDEIERDVTLREPPWRDLPEVCLAWHGACTESVALRPGRLLVSVAEQGSIDLARVSDESLAAALAAFKTTPVETAGED